jgi:branched-chain amino acid transport system permease protein
VTALAAQFQFNYLWLSELFVFVAIYAVLAGSLNLVTGYAGMFSLGHHGFYAVGAYAAASVVSAWGPVDPGSASGIACFAASVLAAAVAAAAAGFAVGLPCLRLRGDYLAIATLAFGEIVRISIQNTPALGGSKGYYVPRVLMDPSGRLETFRTLFLGLGALLVLVTFASIRNLVRSAHGRAIVSIREDEIASELLGVRTTLYKMRAFVLGSAFAGSAGALYAHYVAQISPLDFDLMLGIRVLLIVVLGGLGSLSGSLLAAVLLIGMERLLQTGVFGETVKDWVQVEYALLLILLMLLRPQGILGGRELVSPERLRRLLPFRRASEAP